MKNCQLQPNAFASRVAEVSPQNALWVGIPLGTKGARGLLNKLVPIKG